MTIWLNDDNGNKCSVEYFGSKEAAQKALDSLENCKNCINCSRCSRCSRCSGCSGCSRCSRCSDCSRCSGCSDCSRCSGCSGCSDCSHIAFKIEVENLQAGETTQKKLGPPLIPVIENIHQKVYQAATVPPDAFDMSTWHSCGTTHCRGGWVVHLAGEAGYALEAFFNTELAAMMIYAASGFLINPCRFYDGNAEALADMKKLADIE